MRQYRNHYRNHATQIPNNLHEHYDMQAKVSYIGYMEDPHIPTNDVAQQIKKIKERKSVGPDGMTPDLFFAKMEITYNVLIFLLNQLTQ